MRLFSAVVSEKSLSVDSEELMAGYQQAQVLANRAGEDFDRAGPASSWLERQGMLRHGYDQLRAAAQIIDQDYLPFDFDQCCQRCLVLITRPQPPTDRRFNCLLIRLQAMVHDMQLVVKRLLDETA